METEEKVVEITYEVFQSLLNRISLEIKSFEPERVEEKWIYSFDLFDRRLGRNFTTIKGAVHTFGLRTRAVTPDAALNALFIKMIENKVWVGTYSNYTSVIEWSEGQQQFIERKLTREEIFHNFSF